MAFQIRHSEFGVFQGEFLGMGFWHPSSDMPEVGLARYETKEDAQREIDFMCSDRCASPEAYRGKLAIEPFDEELNAICEALKNVLKQNGGKYHQ
jgi:hypothetical protein